MKMTMHAVALMLLLFAGNVYSDIVLSIVSIDNMDSYIDVLSNAWPTLYPKLADQLSIASSQLPIEYSYMTSVLDLDEIPSTFEGKWARSFLENARKIGPTTIYANAIKTGNHDGDAQRPTATLTQDNDETTENTAVPTEAPTVFLAINGAAGRKARKATKEASSETNEQPSDSASIKEALSETNEQPSDSASTKESSEAVSKRETHSVSLLLAAGLIMTSIAQLY